MVPNWGSLRVLFGLGLVLCPSSIRAQGTIAPLWILARGDLLASARSFQGSVPGEEVAACGDLNHDGFGDFATGDPSTETLRAFSGRGHSSFVPGAWPEYETSFPILFSVSAPSIAPSGVPILAGGFGYDVASVGDHRSWQKVRREVGPDRGCAPRGSSPWPGRCGARGRDDSR